MFYEFTLEQQRQVQATVSIESQKNCAQPIFSNFFSNGQIRKLDPLFVKPQLQRWL
jgi:hypothetical protein